MPEVIDNVKVGAYIKELLRKNSMTQDDLANKLNISKSAVSQNLRGKSSFDIQNLINIAKIFDISLDELLSLKSSDQEVVSEYKKVVDKGIDVFKSSKSQNLIINQPDLYGKVLVDYIIESKNIEMFEYLSSQDVSFVDEQYHRALQLYLDIIIFVLENDIKNPFKYIEKYKLLNKSFLINDNTYRLKVWGLLNQEKYDLIVEKILTYKPQLFDKRRFFKNESDLGYLSKTDIIEIIAEYQLSNIFNVFLRTVYKDTQFLYIIKMFKQHHFLKGLHHYISTQFDKDLSWLKKITIDAQQGFIEVIDLKDIEVIELFIEKKLYTDLTKIVITLIKNNIVKVSVRLIREFNHELNYRKLGETALMSETIMILDEIMPFLNQNDKDYLLSVTDADNIPTIIYLLEHDARIDEKYYNLTTFRKVNNIINHFIRKEKK